MALLSHMLKAADATGASLPPIQIEPLPASSKNTIRGMTPPVSYTRVHTSTAPQPDAGAMQQKSQPAMGMMALPKQAHVFSGEDATMNMTGRPLIQDIVKSAMERTVGRAKIAEEGARHIRRRLDEAEPEEKVASDAEVSTEYAHKLAAAVEYVLPHVKSASFGPARLSETITQPPEGVSHSAVGGQLPGPGGYGHAHHQPPMSPGSRKGLPQEHGQTQMENTLDTHVPGVQQLSITGGHGKTASAELRLGRNLARIDKLAVSGEWAMRGAMAGAAQRAGHSPEVIAKMRAGGGLGGKMVDELHKELKTPHLERVKGFREGVADLHSKGIPEQGIGPTPKFTGRKSGKTGPGMANAEGPSKGVAYSAAPAKGAPAAAPAAAKTEGGGISGKHLAYGAGGALGLGVGAAGLHHMSRDKNASLTLVDALREHVKRAADENNPAKISAGAAVPPETSAAGEAGGAPAGGMPVGPRHLVHSNESAINFKRNAAYGNRKSDLKAYLSEPALTNSTDSTLQAAFAHTGEAGTKLASEENEKVAAARALLAKITERVQAQ